MTDKTKKAAIVIDRWKLPIFTRHIKQAGYSYSEEGDFTKDTLILTVQTDDLNSLKVVVVEATAECARTKEKK